MLSGGLRLRGGGREDLLSGLYLIFGFYFHSCIFQFDTSRGQDHHYFTSYTVPAYPQFI
jgi:hypothetical protein